jgi:endonuclease/exonuclease/phosphatase family metal-dependent hydrolase
MNRRRLAALATAVAVATVAAGSCGDDRGDLAEQAAAVQQVRVVSQNLLHGYACPADTAGCRLQERIELFLGQLGEECPDLVGLQEMNEEMIAAVSAALPELCDGAYEMAGGEDPGLDREVVLTRSPVLAAQRFRLAGPFRSVLWVRVAAPVGVVDLWTTHLAATSDDGACTASACPAPCTSDDTLNSCQARQIVELAGQRRVTDGVVVVAGDLNATAGAPTLAALTDAGFVDTHLEAGNPECDPRSGARCTSGRDDESLRDLTDPSSRQAERIDYVLVDPLQRCSVGEGTGVFHPDPVSPPEADPGGVVFASDHSGVVAVIDCETTPRQQRSASTATTAETTTTAAAQAVQSDPATVEAIGDAFTTVFGGGGAPLEERLQALEDPAAVEELFRTMYAQTAEMADRIVVRVDAVAHDDSPTTAAVTFSLLLDGNPVVDHMQGSAVGGGGRGGGAAPTKGSPAPPGATDVPAACR